MSKQRTTKRPDVENHDLDDALDASFPASDPPSMTVPGKHVGKTEDAPPRHSKPKK